MWIVAVAWIYVVGLMAVTEPSVVAGIMTFFLYCVLPLSILCYLTGSRRRRARNERHRGNGRNGGDRHSRNDSRNDNDSDSGSSSDSGDSGSDSGGGDGGGGGD